MELKLSREPVLVSCFIGESRFRNLVLSAAKHHTPGGYIRNYISILSDTAKTLTIERDYIKTRNFQNSNLHTIKQRIASEVAAHKRRAWEEEVCGCSNKKNPSNYWGFLVN